jgi:GntR family transcriptional regulator of arabinose operon
MRGFLRAFRERKQPVAADWVVRYSSEEKTSRPLEALERMLEREAEERPTAIFCYNDELAVRMLDIIRRRGLTVPDDLSMIGFDDSNLAVATEVKLTTIAHPKTSMGADAVELLMKLITQRTPRASLKDVVYEPALVERESVKVLTEKNA